MWCGWSGGGLEGVCCAHHGVEGAGGVLACDVHALRLAEEGGGGGFEDVQAVGVGGEDGGLTVYREVEVGCELGVDLAVGEEEALVGGVVVWGVIG